MLDDCASDCVWRAVINKIRTQCQIDPAARHSTVGNEVPDVCHGSWGRNEKYVKNIFDITFNICMCWKRSTHDKLLLLASLYCITMVPCWCPRTEISLSNKQKEGNTLSSHAYSDSNSTGLTYVYSFSQEQYQIWSIEVTVPDSRTRTPSSGWNIKRIDP